MEYHSKRIIGLHHFVREFEILLSLQNHRNIISLEEIDVNYSGGILNTQMCSITLKDFFTIQQDSNIRMTLQHRFIDELGSAISYLAVNGIIHCDLKLDNIVVTQINHDASLRLIDFGSAIHLNDECHYSRCGSIKYRPPEAAKFKDIKTPKAIDMWALGLINVEILNFRSLNLKPPLGYCDYEVPSAQYIIQNTDFDIPIQYINIINSLLERSHKLRRNPFEDIHTFPERYPKCTYTPSHPDVIRVIDELGLPEHILNDRPINSLIDLWRSCHIHGIHISDEYLSQKVDNLYDQIINVTNDVFRSRKGYDGTITRRL